MKDSRSEIPSENVARGVVAGIAELLIDHLEEDRARRAVVVGMLRERWRYGRWR